MKGDNSLVDGLLLEHLASLALRSCRAGTLACLWCSFATLGLTSTRQVAHALVQVVDPDPSKDGHIPWPSRGKLEVRQGLMKRGGRDKRLGTRGPAAEEEQRERRVGQLLSSVRGE